MLNNGSILNVMKTLTVIVINLKKINIPNKYTSL